MDEDEEDSWQEEEHLIVGKYFIGMMFCGEIRPYFWHNETAVHVHRDGDVIMEFDLDLDDEDQRGILISNN
jgi:hypothetical protein